jgi:hypothetical protein
VLDHRGGRHRWEVAQVATTIDPRTEREIIKDMEREISRAMRKAFRRLDAAREKGSPA